MTVKALEAAVNTIGKLSTRIYDSLSEGSLPNKYRLHVAEWMRLWEEAKHRIGEVMEEPKIMDETRIADLIKGYVNPVLTLGELIVKKEKEFKKGKSLDFLEAILNDFTIKVKQLDAMPMVLLTQEESEENSLSIKPSSKDGTPYFVFVNKSLVNNEKMWSKILHEPSHLISYHSRSKEMAEEMFC
ncbi:MAG: hypothetical protein KAW09_05870, partial [Thermoplasmata archaeon]|nr:hypothetical protein [Thermoplasmata archaeon]